MRITQYFAVLGFCLLMGACILWKGDLDIDIGDYEDQLAAWNSQNMLDYSIVVNDFGSPNNPQSAKIAVKNGIPQYSLPSYWLEYDRISTIPEFYSLIKSYEKIFKDSHNNGASDSYSLKVSYNTEYHFPHTIHTKVNGNTTQHLTIGLGPPDEVELYIDIGDYEYHLNAWNNQNMLDYRLEVWRSDSFRGTSGYAVSNIKNGIPNDSYITTFFENNPPTVSGIYSFIKEEEERIKDAYNGTNRCILSVQYDTEYHYPKQITSAVYKLLGSDMRWRITLTLPEETEPETGGSEE